MPQSTGSMFANLFGLKPFLDAMNDPETQQYARQFLYYIADTHRRVCVIEELLRAQHGITSAFPEQYGAAGVLPRPFPASRPPDDGSGRPAGEAGEHEPRIFGTGANGAAGVVSGGPGAA